MKPKDLPVQELLELADQTLRDFPGSQVHFRWTCEGCGSRQTFEEPNQLFAFGDCEECGHRTKIEKGGFAFLAGIGCNPEASLNRR